MRPIISDQKIFLLQVVMRRRVTFYCILHGVNTTQIMSSEPGIKMPKGGRNDQFHCCLEMGY